MITADFHTHTSFSGDSHSFMESMIEQAIQLGLSSICITDHMDYLYPPQYKSRFTFDAEEYFSALSRQKEHYQKRIELLYGVELGLRNEPEVREECMAYYEKLIGKYPFDFVIGSTHVLKNLDPYFPEYWAAQKPFDAIMAYFEAILDNLENYPMFQVYGHLDYVIRYMPGDVHDYCYQDYQEVIDEILKRLIQQGRGIELNTAGYKYGLSFAHPRPEILKRYKELGGEILTIGSDAHEPRHLAYDFQKAREVLISLGYRYYTIYRGRKPSFIAL